MHKAPARYQLQFNGGLFINGKGIINSLLILGIFIRSSATDFSLSAVSWLEKVLSGKKQVCVDRFSTALRAGAVLIAHGYFTRSFILRALHHDELPGVHHLGAQQVGYRRRNNFRYPLGFKFKYGKSHFVLG